MFRDVQRKSIMKPRSKSVLQNDRICNIIQILKTKSSEQRTNDDILILSNTIQRFAPLNKFTGIGDLKLVQQYCSQLNYRFYKSQEIIIQQGCKGDEFFILLMGQIDTLNNCFGYEIIKGLPYQQTVKAITDCHLAFLKKQVYIKIKQQSKLQDIQEQIGFLNKSQLFGKLSIRTLESLLPFFKIEFFERKQIVYKEGDESEYIYLVKEGEFDLQKLFRLKQKTMKVCISNIGQNEIFGELGNSLLNKTRQYSVICKYNAICYKIQKDNFYQKVISENPSEDIESYINNYIKTQTLSRNERLTTISDTIEGNCKYLLGLKEIQTNQADINDFKKIELRLLDKTHSRYTLLYNSQNKQKVKVRYATIHKCHVAVPRCTSKTEQDERIISVSVKKSPERQKLAYIYDEIEVPDTIKRKYQLKLQELQTQILGLRKQHYQIKTYNNQSQIIATNY